jgi:hypothetical protein
MTEPVNGSDPKRRKTGTVVEDIPEPNNSGLFSSVADELPSTPLEDIEDFVPVSLREEAQKLQEMEQELLLSSLLNEVNFLTI